MHVLGFWSEYTKLNNLCGVVATGTGTCMLPFLVYGGGGGGGGGWVLMLLGGEPFKVRGVVWVTLL